MKHTSVCVPHQRKETHYKNKGMSSQVKRSLKLYSLTKFCCAEWLKCKLSLLSRLKIQNSAFIFYMLIPVPVSGSKYDPQMSKIVQQDTTIYSFIILLQNSPTCFAWYPHLSSGAHTNCNYNIWHWSNHICYCPLLWRSWNSRTSVPTPSQQRMVANKVRRVPDVVITVCVWSWWWMRVSCETCRAVLQKYNKTVYRV